MLTERQKLFCHYYLISFNAREANEKAGFKKVNNNLLNNKHVREYLRKSLNSREDGLIAKQEDVMRYLSDCVFGKATEQQSFVLRSGDKRGFNDTIKTIDVPIKIRDRLKAAETMAKIYRLMSGEQQERPKIIINNSIPRNEKK